MNFRYIKPTVIIEALFMGIMSDKIITDNNSKTVIYITETLTLLFEMCSIIVYLAVGCSSAQ